MRIMSSRFSLSLLSIAKAETAAKSMFFLSKRFMELTLIILICRFLSIFSSDFSVFVIFQKSKTKTSEPGRVELCCRVRSHFVTQVQNDDVALRQFFREEDQRR